MGGVVMKVLIEPGNSRNVLATIAIGDAYYGAWEKYAQAGWESYCRRHGLGLIVFDQDLLSSDLPTWKKATWQKMLIAEKLVDSGLEVANVCYLDTDILIGSFAPDIFQFCDPQTIGLVSLRNGLPFPYDEVLRRMAFLRHYCYDSAYPLDSALFMSLDQLYRHHELSVQGDEACMGLIVFNVVNHAHLMRQWFDKYDRSVQSITNGGDQTHINYEIQNWGKVTWLDYRFQAIWAFEMAWKYPFLYEERRNDEALIRSCIEASLYQNHFLHFAGSWHESRMWKVDGVFSDVRSLELVHAYQGYLAETLTGNPVGFVKPSN
jgi:hypothetical protein